MYAVLKYDWVWRFAWLKYFLRITSDSSSMSVYRCKGVLSQSCVKYWSRHWRTTPFHILSPSKYLMQQFHLLQWLFKQLCTSVSTVCRIPFMIFVVSCLFFGILPHYFLYRGRMLVCCGQCHTSHDIGFRLFRRGLGHIWGTALLRYAISWRVAQAAWPPWCQ